MTTYYRTFCSRWPMQHKDGLRQFLWTFLLNFKLPATVNPNPKLSLLQLFSHLISETPLPPMAPIRVAILTGLFLPACHLHVADASTVSDTAFADATADRSGPVIQDIITSHHGEVESDKHYRIVPDTVEAIQSVVKEWADNGNVDWIITTGGTGFGVRDVTPEVMIHLISSFHKFPANTGNQAITPLLNRPAPGLVHLLLSASLQHTPLAALSRPVAGVIKSTLITTLPGSVKAVKENMDALMRGGVVQHAVELLRGGTGAQVHAILAGGEQRSMSHNGHRHGHDHGAHVHHHDHHVPIPRSVQVLSHDPSAPGMFFHFVIDGSYLCVYSVCKTQEISLPIDLV
jgi:molybdenum cofactor synthesis domain-containing protein